MDTTTKSQFDISQLRKLIQKALKLPDGSVIGGSLPENDLSAFVTADILFSKEIGISRRVFNASFERVTSSLLSTVSISCYGNNAYPLAVKIRNILQSSRLIAGLKAMNAGIVSFSDVRNLTVTVGADYEERGQFDFIISHHHIVDVDLEPIEKVDVVGTIQTQI